VLAHFVSMACHGTPKWPITSPVIASTSVLFTETTPNCVATASVGAMSGMVDVYPRGYIAQTAI
jgi:hypothetical protein